MSGDTQSSSLLSGKVENISNLNYNTKALLPQHDGLHFLLWPCSKYFQSWRQHLQVTHTGSFGGGKTERKEENDNSSCPLVPDPRLERSLHHQQVRAAGEPGNLLPAQHRVQLRIRAHLPGDHQDHVSRGTCHTVVMQDHIIIRLVSGLLGRMTITAAYFVCLQVSAVTCHVSRYTCARSTPAS